MHFLIITHTDWFRLYTLIINMKMKVTNEVGESALAMIQIQDLNEETANN